MPIETNLRLLRKSKKAPSAGDIFAMQMRTGEFLFGRVIIARPPRENAPMPESNLIYIYKLKSNNKIIQHEKLIERELLLPPIWTNALGWSRGYFETVNHMEITKDILLEQHCFEDKFPRFGRKFLDETGRAIPQRVEPCGIWGLVSYRWIDDHICDALCIPRSPNIRGRYT